MKEKVIENVKSLGIALVLALVIRAFIIQSFHIPSGSMIPTLLVHDFILVDKVTYHLRKPDRGDVVVFHYPLNEKIYYIKRIIGIPGDRVQLRDGVVYINGKPVNIKEDGNYKYYEKGTERRGKLFIETIPRSLGGEKEHFILKTGITGDNTNLFVIPEGKYFMMGDNRNNSYDSRYWGFVDRDKIVGIARIIFFSWDSNSHMPRFSRIGKLIN